MRDELRALCDLFIENRDILRKAFRWESAYLYPVCAAVFTGRGQTADPAALRHCDRILKEQTGPFNGFRGTARLAILSLLAADGDPGGRLRRALGLYDALKGYFFVSQYLPVAAMLLAEETEKSRYAETAARCRRIYDLMKAEHPFLTSGEDSIFAALLALSPRPEEETVEETEGCYRLLKPAFFSANAVQSLSHVLALGEYPAEEKCQRTMGLYQGLKDRGYKYGTEYELATLGVLALLPEEPEAIIEKVIQADDYLSGQSGYGLLGLGRKQRLMHAGMLVSAGYREQAAENAMQSAAVGGTLSLVAAQQAALCAAVAAASAAAGASASAGGN